MQPFTPGQTPVTPGLVEHYESVLGTIDSAWSALGDDDAVRFSVLRFRGAPMRGAETLATLGLSHTRLALPRGRAVRQELVVTCYERFAGDDLAALLQAVGEDVLDKGTALLRGEVLGPAGQLLPDTALTALYVSVPAVFPDQLHGYEGSDPETVIVWLVPISTGEATLVRERGWSAFEELLEAADPDLFDLHRASLVPS
jgi:Suppressor of fused protein (SUFU)